VRIEPGILFSMGCSSLAPAATGDGGEPASQQGCTPTNFPASLGLHHFRRTTGICVSVRIKRPVRRNKSLIIACDCLFLYRKLYSRKELGWIPARSATPQASDFTRQIQHCPEFVTMPERFAGLSRRRA
jgi:hypothetical protein